VGVCVVSVAVANSLVIVAQYHKQLISRLSLMTGALNIKGLKIKCRGTLREK